MSLNCFSGSRSRRFPVPTKNPFTWLFVFVSCPNYTYEVTESIHCSLIRQLLSPWLYFTSLFACIFDTYCRLDLGWAFPSWPSACQVCIYWQNLQTAPITTAAWKCMCSNDVMFCIPVAFYTLLGFIQMSIWAKGKHRAYSREFKDYPSLRMAIIPLILWYWCSIQGAYVNLLTMWPCTG